MEADVVAGIELGELLGYAARGETWSARDTATGAACRVTLATGEGGGPAAAELLHFRHPHALTTDAVLPASAGRVAVCTAVPPELTLAALLAARRVLTAAEVVTVGVPVASALGAAHEAGLVHGDLDAADVALDERGRPLLLGLGVAALAGLPAAPADDVAVLARLLTALLGDTAGPTADAVRAALAPGLAGHPAARPGAADLALALGRACPARALELTSLPAGDTQPVPALPLDGPRWRQPTEEPPTRRLLRPGVAARPDRRLTASRRPPRRVVIGAAIGLAVLLAVAVVGSGHRSAPPPPAGAAAPLVLPDDVGASVGAAGDPGVGAAGDPGGGAAGDPGVGAAGDASGGAAGDASGVPAPSGSHTTAVVDAPATTQAAPDWAVVLRGLAAARAEAFAASSPATLALADAPGSAAARIDVQRLAAWTSAGAHTGGAASQVLAVRPISVAAGTAVLLSREQLPAYDVLGADGTVRAHRPAGAPATWRITLTRTAAGWRTSAVAAG